MRRNLLYEASVRKKRRSLFLSWREIISYEIAESFEIEVFFFFFLSSFIEMRMRI